MRLEHIKNVMVVDDDSLFVDNLTGILRNEGFRVTSASNCLDALYVASDDVPDLFLVNLVMPTISGDRFCRILRSQQHLAGSYRVILTALADEADLDLGEIDAHASVAKEPSTMMTANLFSVLQRLDQQAGQRAFDKQRQSENEQNALKEKLQHAQKMEAVGTLTSGVAHDFNNILQTILGYAQLSLIENEVPPTVRKNIEEIQASAQKATSLIRRMLVFCRKVDSQHRPIDLNQQISHVTHMLERTIPRMIQIDCQLDQGLKLTKADGNSLEQSLMNLGVNARDAMPDGGVLSFRTRNVELDDTFCDSHPGARPGPYVQLTVSDTGVGMTDNVRRHIFDPFFTTKESGQGTGLGLAMVYGIVKDHDGFITCDSKPRQGTVFTVYLPSIDAEEEDEAAHAAKAEKIPGGTETILLIDDEKCIRDFGQQILTKYGYTVITAKSGEEALDIYRRWNTIELVIVDLSMPGMGGLQCIEQLIGIRPDCRIIVSSGYAAKDQIKTALGAGAQEFIAKPYFIRDLLAKIRYVINLT